MTKMTLAQLKALFPVYEPHGVIKKATKKGYKPVVHPTWLPSKGQITPKEYARRQALKKAKKVQS